MASALRFETLVMPAASLGRDNPLPPLTSGEHLSIVTEYGPEIPAEVRGQIGYGRLDNYLPYSEQNGYDRVRRPRPFRVAVLENEWLRATFLLELGGRLASLEHLPSGRELLCPNPVFQPANLAIRNAWFSGGVEWNIGIRGHSVFTCAPLFAERLSAPDGTPVLRLREWERILQVPFQMDFWLPPGSPFLYAHVRIANQRDVEIPMYWWSNIATPEAPGTRVLVPATHTFKFDYDKQTRHMQRIPMPLRGNVDFTYPTNIVSAADFFFDLEEGQRPWIASLDAAGGGLIQTSTARLRGRKLFVWGMSPGGRRWQEFLSEPNHPYIELQAGLTRTQVECLPMPPGAVWDWTEAYGLMEAPPAAVHGADWQAARETVARRLDALLPAAEIARQAEIGAAIAATPPGERQLSGSGWGALEARRLRARSPSQAPETALADDDALGPEQAPWLALLEKGRLPEKDPEIEPGGWMVQQEWRDMLEQSVARGDSDHWLAWLHLGVMRYAGEDRAGAAAAWRQSLALRRSAWALRNLAVLARQDKRPYEAAELLSEACDLQPRLATLAVECGKAQLQAGRAADWLERCARMPEELRAQGRIKLLEVRAHVMLSHLDAAEEMMRNDLVVGDIREGEITLTDIWFELAALRLEAATGAPLDDALRARASRECPPPPHLDFRMKAP